MNGFLRLRSDALAWREIEGQIVSVDLRGSVYLATNRTGAALWPALVEGTTPEALVDILTSRYGVESDAATADVEAFVQMLHDRDLLDREAR